jgi:hypothetical protein
MTIRRLQRDDWSGFCIHVMRGFLGKWVECFLNSQVKCRGKRSLGLQFNDRIAGTVALS